MKLIDSFNGNFEFLSNFSEHGFRVKENNVLWITNEHYFQAMKSINMVERGVIWSCKTPGKAKRFGRVCELREDWNDVKDSIMEDGVRMKFEQNPYIKQKLMSLDGYTLVEGNHWHDNYWGNCWCNKCKDITGKNMLGKILMKVRNEFLL